MKHGLWFLGLAWPGPEDLTQRSGVGGVGPLAAGTADISEEQRAKPAPSWTPAKLKAAKLSRFPAQRSGSHRDADRSAPVIHGASALRLPEAWLVLSSWGRASPVPGSG